MLERGDGVGGTWRANNYPGAACDVPSHLYSLSFAPNPWWSRAYASQPEILRYIEECYDRLDVRQKVRLRSEVVEAQWSPADERWTVRDRQGQRYRPRYLVSAIGMFHTPSFPDISGLADFDGPVFHSARWDHPVDLSGKRVAVIGTGASAIQIVPAIAAQTAQLDLYQRTAPWVLPRRDPPYSADQQQLFSEFPGEALEHRQSLYELLEQSTAFMAGDPSREALAAAALQYLESEVTDPELRSALTPTHPFGCTRPLVSSDYYPAVQRSNVDLVTEGIEHINLKSVRTVDQVDRETDAIVLCTGFRASSYMGSIGIFGRTNVSIHDYWNGLPRAYHGLMVPGFPNFFMMYGPNTNQGGNSILLILEAQAQFITNALQTVRDAGSSSIEVSSDAMDSYSRDLDRDLAGTVWASGCRSYFHTASGAIVTQLPHKSSWYRDKTQVIDVDHFLIGAGTCTTS